MRYAIALVLAGGCIGNDIPATSFASVDGAPTVKYARTTNGITNYGGTAYYQWNVILATIESCTAGDTRATFEINTLVLGSPNAFPTGTIPIRADQIPATAPSALVTFDGATGTTGSITIEAVDTDRVSGSIDATLTTGPMTGSFIAFTCP